LAQRLNRRWVFFQSPNRSGRSPGNSGAVSIKHRLDESAIIASGGADMANFPQQQIRYPLPLITAQSIPGHGQPVL